MKENSEFKNYLLYSLSFHALVLILLILFVNIETSPPEPRLQVTMIRLTRGTGDLRSPWIPRPGGVETKPPVPVPPASPPEIKVPPKVEAPPPQPPKIKPPTVTLPGKEQKPKPPAAVLPPAFPAPDEQKMKDALAQVQKEVQERETTQTASAPPGSGTGTVPGFGSPQGAVSAVDPEFARYQSMVRSKIIREWIRTSAGEQTQVLRARINVRINASGAVISTTFAKRSGDAAFDNSAQRAVERASPLPPPPEGIRTEALSEGFVVDFSSRVLGRQS